MSAAQPAARLMRLDPSFHALGLVLDYLSRSVGFQDYRLGGILGSVRHQLDRGTNIGAFRGERIVGYCGWMEIAEAQGQLWLAGLGTLRPLPRGSHADAFAMTVVAGEETAVVRQMMREARTQNRGRRAFFKRDYGPRGSRKSQVLAS